MHITLMLAALAAASAPALAESPEEAIRRIDGQRMSEVRPKEGFRYFSGNLATFHTLPTIYASGRGKRARLTVVGPEYEQHFPLSERAAAYAAYETLLRRFGMLAGD